MRVLIVTVINYYFHWYVFIVQFLCVRNGGSHVCFVQVKVWMSNFLLLFLGKINSLQCSNL